MADKEYRFFIATKAQHAEGVRRGIMQDNFLLYLYDTHEIYKGAEKYGADNFIVCASQPENPYPDKLYCINGELYHYITEYGWIKLSTRSTLDITGDDADRDAIPTSGAVLDAINAAVANMNGTISGMSWSDKIGTITVARKEAEPEAVELKGVVLKPKYDSATNVLTLPIVGGEAIEVGLGSDTCITSGHIAADGETLVLSTADDEEAVLIDVRKLASKINIGAVKESSTIAFSFDEEGVMTAEVKVSAEEGNTLEVKEDGLYSPKGNVVLF